LTGITTMPNEIAPAQMLRIPYPYPEPASCDTSSVVRFFVFGNDFEARFRDVGHDDGDYR
jgi:hypothetical protein